MKKLFLFYFLLGAIAVSAQEISPFDRAQSDAAETGKRILLVFSGSDWCGPCIKMDKQLWSTSEFQTYAKDHLIFFKADFPRRKKNQLPPEQQQINNKLAATYNPEGYFPRVLLLNAQGEILKQFTYDKRSPKAFIQALQ